MLLAIVPSAHAETTCASSGGSPAAIAAIESRLEVRLVDGRLLRLVGLDPALPTVAEPERAETSRTHLAKMVSGQPVTVRVEGTEDRWGRLPAQIFLADKPATGGLAAKAMAEGLGRYLAEPSAHGCRDVLLDAEAKARDGKLGLWSDPYYAVLAVDDSVGFTARSGTIVLVEGRLAAVIPGPYRTKLRFAAPESKTQRGERTVAAVILPRTVKTFEAQRVDFKALIGRTMRLRGLLDQRFGPQIEVRGPDDIEWIEAPRDPAGSP